MVGTAPPPVTFSDSIILASGSACRNRSGMIRDAPTISAAYGRPQALAWNMGTTASSRSPWAKPMPMITCIVCRKLDRWE